MRVVVLSDQGVKPLVSVRNSGHALESTLAQLPDATLVAPPRLRRPTVVGARPAWLSAIRTVRRADVVFWSQLHLHPAPSVWALAYLRPLAPRVVYALDPFQPVIRDLVRILDAQKVRHCFLSYRQAADEIRRGSPNLSVEWLPIGFARDVFHDLEVERDLDVYWMGRRHEALHEAMAEVCRRRGWIYRFSRYPGDPPSTDELNALISRSRYFVVTPPNIDNASRTGRFSPLTSRYLEGLGAGSRLLGVLPESGEFESILPLDAIVQCAPNGSDLEAVLDADMADPKREQKRKAARDLAHRQHAWEQRALTIYDRFRELYASS